MAADCSTVGRVLPCLVDLHCWQPRRSGCHTCLEEVCQQHRPTSCAADKAAWQPPPPRGDSDLSEVEIVASEEDLAFPCTPSTASGGSGERADLREGEDAAFARQELLEACEKGGLASVRRACESAEAAGYSRAEVAALRRRIQELCLARLLSALARAEAAVVEPLLLARARALCRELRAEGRRVQAAAELQDLRRSSSCGSVEEACQRAELAGLTSSDVDALRKKLTKLYCNCLEKACSRAELAGVAGEEILEAQADIAGLQSSLQKASQRCFGGFLPQLVPLCGG